MIDGPEGKSFYIGRRWCALTRNRLKPRSILAWGQQDTGAAGEQLSACKRRSFIATAPHPQQRLAMHGPISDLFPPLASTCTHADHGQGKRRGCRQTFALYMLPSTLNGSELSDSCPHESGGGGQSLVLSGEDHPSLPLNIK